MTTKPFFYSAKMFFIVPILLAGIFAIIFFQLKDSATINYTTIITQVPSIANYGQSTAQKVQNIIGNYGYATGVVLALVYFILSLFLVLIFKIIQLGKFNFTNPLALLIALVPFGLFANNMITEGSTNTAISAGIITFLAYPLWYTSLIISIILILILLCAIFKKSKTTKITQLLILISLSFSLSGCDWLNALTSISCMLNPDSAHCYQEEAVGSGEEEKCEKIPQKAEFKDVGSNPPKDKCYLMIAQNKGDPLVCDKIQGGMGSYSKEECESEALKNGDPNKCSESKDEAKCRAIYGAKTGNCGVGYTFDATTQNCIKGEGDKDPECADPTFTSKCASSNSVLICTNGKKSIKNCEFGCFEATCRTSAGPTDIAPVEPTAPGGDNPTDPNNPSDPKDPNDPKDPPPPECACSENQTCKDGKCVNKEIEPECLADNDCKPDQKCLNKFCVISEAECLFSEDCSEGKKCENKKCVAMPACKSGDKMCTGANTLEYCENEKIVKKDCPFGCNESKCLTQQEKEDKEAKEKEELACKAGYKKCLSDTTLTICDNGQKTETKCEFGCKSGVCLEEKEDCPGWQKWNPFCKETDEDIEDKTAADVKTIGDAVNGKYMEALDDLIDGEKDPYKLEGLQKYKEFLEKAGETMEDVGATVDTLKELKRIFLDSYDKSMDIDNMSADKILKKGLFDKISDSIWGEPTTEAGKEMAEAEDSLAVYEAMLKRQQEIDFLLQSKLGRLGQVISENAKSAAVDKVKDMAEDIGKNIAGDAMIAVGVVDYALKSFQDEAQKQMFVGLARAYNRRRAELESQFPNMSEEEIHSHTVSGVQDMPYEDSKGTTFVKYGNLIENKDCQDSSNPLCVDNRVWWKAMQKTYEHGHSSELTQRTINQFDAKMNQSKGK